MSATARRRLLALAFVGGCRVEYVVPIDEDSECADELVSCGALCIDLEADPNHCGGCGNACALEHVCDEGECKSSCSDGREVCDQRCVDTDDDPQHCGTCGNACAADESCHDGECRDSCDGSCDPTRELCVMGQCACRPGLEPCGSTCVDTSTDPNHCGACDMACDGMPCGDSTCRPEGCAGFPDQCGDSCTDLASDPLHCGQCDEPCAADELCANGQCEPIDSG